MNQPVRCSNHPHILVCRSCGEACRFPDSNELQRDRTSLEIKQFLEEQLLNDPSQSWSVRVVESSCLDVCPRGAVSVRLVGAKKLRKLMPDVDCIDKKPARAAARTDQKSPEP